jgi:hypothetical protein
MRILDPYFIIKCKGISLRLTAILKGESLNRKTDIIKKVEKSGWVEVFRINIF